ncbi:hypothetical protein I4F81_002290 [Pyropia yezoensis]|uniref:Uncharacterized protein n=1 Tax=Pyropia yezoensis TaxID=2788 RepID=A0ACC3BNZ1_PYRYE|nr:hypothetical protein I4F81_002290 [Neopyropia yezoensis]
MATTPAFVGQTGGRFAQVAAARLLSRSGRRAAPCAGNRGYVAPAFHAPAAARARPRRQPGARLVYSRTPTMGLEKVKLGSSDLEVTQVCLGTMTFGIQNSEEEAHAQLDYAILERGVNFIDTAELYPVPSSDPAWFPGATEEILGRWLAKATAADPGLRSRLVIATKMSGYIGSTTIPGYRSDPPVKEKMPARLDAASVKAAVEASLRRLGVDTIDLFQLHWPDRYVPIFGSTVYSPSSERPDSVPIAETLKAIKDVMDLGKVRHYGLSNETSYGLCQAVAAADALGMVRPATIQNSFSLIHRSFEAELAEVASHSKVSLLPWSPLAGGSLSGKYLDEADAPAEEVSSWRYKRFPQFQSRYVSKDSLAAVAAYKEIAKEAGMPVATLALAWCRSRWYVGSTIIGATKMGQLKENIDAFDEDLTPSLSKEVLAKIDAVHLRQKDPATV